MVTGNPWVEAAFVVATILVSVAALVCWMLWGSNFAMKKGWNMVQEFAFIFSPLIVALYLLYVYMYWV